MSMMNEEKILVSVFCTVYNHELYIRKALEGFVSQKTNFKFEVLINDDASTDKSADIIREYEKKYPDLIKPVYQTENQFSKGISISRTFFLPRAKGKYIALCEGDDFWVDSLKLQKQVDYMECHPNCTFCFTNGLIGNVVQKVAPYISIFHNRFNSSKVDFDIAEINSIFIINTCSFFFRYKDYVSIPRPPASAFAGDTYLQLYLTYLGYAHYINDITCFYNKGREGSLTTIWRDDREQKIRAEYRYIAMYRFLNKVTQYKYNTMFSRNILGKYYSILQCKDGKIEEVFDSDFRDVLRKSGCKAYVWHHLTYTIPCGKFFLKTYHVFKGGIKGICTFYTTFLKVR